MVSNWKKLDDHTMEKRMDVKYNLGKKYMMEPILAISLAKRLAIDLKTTTISKFIAK